MSSQTVTSVASNRTDADEPARATPDRVHASAKIDFASSPRPQPRAISVALETIDGYVPPGQEVLDGLAYIVADHRDIPDDQVAAQIDSIAHDEVDSLLWAADLSRVNVAVQVDFSHLAGVLRVIATGKGVERTILPEESCGRVDTFTSFIEEVATHCPADRYLMLVWGHGQGPIGFFADAHADGVMERRRPHVVAARIRGRAGVCLRSQGIQASHRHPGR
jgi:hypothetical protein